MPKEELAYEVEDGVFFGGFEEVDQLIGVISQGKNGTSNFDWNLGRSSLVHKVIRNTVFAW